MLSSQFDPLPFAFQDCLTQLGDDPDFIKVIVDSPFRKFYVNDTLKMCLEIITHVMSQNEAAMWLSAYKESLMLV